MNTSYTSPESFFANASNEEQGNIVSQDMQEANNVLKAAIQDPVFDTMTDEQVTVYVIAGSVTAFVFLFTATYILALVLGLAALALGLPSIAQFIIACIPSILSIIYIEKMVRYFIAPIVAKSMVFYAKTVSKVKTFFSKKKDSSINS